MGCVPNCVINHYPKGPIVSLKVCVLGSGSSGNCTVIWTRDEALLIDCGSLGVDYVMDNLRKLNFPLLNLKGIVISHGHRDHIDSTAIKIAKILGIPIYIHEKTYKVVKERFHSIKLLEKVNLIKHHGEENFAVGTFTVMPFRTFHSFGYVGRSFGFCVLYQDKKVGYITDTGKIDSNIIMAMEGAKLAIIEANHQEILVTNGKRNEFNKQWILSDFGHLSNDTAAELIIALSKTQDRLTHVFLAHISEDHNTIEDALGQVEVKIKQRNIKLLPTYHHRPSEVVMV
jgi:phosphoribosyl 1,2-cyclic phosphodiesterase